MDSAASHIRMWMRLRNIFEPTRANMTPLATWAERIIGREPSLTMVRRYEINVKIYSDPYGRREIVSRWIVRTW